MTSILPSNFYLQGDTPSIAAKLLGKVLVHTSADGMTSGRIVAVEDYCTSAFNPACHAVRGKTRCNAVMFGPAGRAHVYFTYGMHYYKDKTCCGDSPMPLAAACHAGLDMDFT